MVRMLTAWLLLASSLAVLAQAPAGGFRAVFDRAVEDFRQGRVEQSAAGFDRLVEMVPENMPRLWQRGIVLYYAGRLGDCREQFESHRTVNPDDVENVAWHFLCVAKSESPEVARASLLPVGPDSRAPMRQIHALLAGTASREDVMSAATGRPAAEFYAHLYLGLYAEALGDEAVALMHPPNGRERRVCSGGWVHAHGRASTPRPARGAVGRRRPGVPVAPL